MCMRYRTTATGTGRCRLVSLAATSLGLYGASPFLEMLHDIACIYCLSHFRLHIVAIAEDDLVTGTNNLQFVPLQLDFILGSEGTASGSRCLVARHDHSADNVVYVVDSASADTQAPTIIVA